MKSKLIHIKNQIFQYSPMSRYLKMNLNFARRTSRLINDKLFTMAYIINSKIYASRKYAYPKFKIILPSDHKLPEYQKKYKNYDKFLPHAAKYLAPNDLIVDVGANCGDTVAAMASTNPNLQYICIEPDNNFYIYLEKNISIIKKNCGSFIQPIKALVGRKITNVVLVGTGGTKNASFNKSNSNNDNLYKSRSLDEIFEKELQDKATYLKLIKSDVDGFDYDVIDSAEKTIAKHNPILFFECQCDDKNQKNYISTIRNLIESGYKSYWIFDNFGELILRTTEIEIIEMLIEYVWRQKKYSSKIIISYFDILCCTKNDEALVTQIVNEYITSISSQK